MLDFNEGSTWVWGQPYSPPPPITGMMTDTGMGKTQQWREKVAAPSVAKGQHPLLLIPLHRLGEEIVENFAAEGIRAFCFRGRDADDPLAPGHKMCREQERVGAISSALADVSRHACKRGDKVCPQFEVCGYQRQQREQPQVSVCAHEMLFRERPGFIRAPDTLGIDERFWDGGLRGADTLKPEKLPLCLLKGDRHIRRDLPGTADLVAISDRVYDVLLREDRGFLRREAFLAAGVTLDELRAALKLEWKRLKKIDDVYPGMPVEQVQLICMRVAMHNQDVRRLAVFWELLIRTLEGAADRSPYLDLRHDDPIGPNGSNKQPAVRMVWRVDIHQSWGAPTVVMDATMSPDIVHQFFPRMSEPVRIKVPTPHTHIRQIIDRPMSAAMLIQNPFASLKTNRTRENHVLEVRKFVETRAYDVAPGRVLVICQKALEETLAEGSLPGNVELAHFNGIAGQNAWQDVALLILIGRTEPWPSNVEKLARALFDADIPPIPDEGYYPEVERGVQMRDGGVAVIASSQHPDPRAEAVRWQICEGELIQAIGRGRAVNRTSANPLQIDILTNYALPIVVDELTTWPLIQPTDAEIMRSRGAVPLSYGDMATAYPDLFASPEAARKSLHREIGICFNGWGENPGQMPNALYLLGICPGFLSISFKIKGFRGPASKLLFDPQRIDPAAWLTQRFGEVKIIGKATKPCRAKPKARRQRRQG